MYIMPILNILKKVPIFKNLKDLDFKKILNILKEKSFKKGDHIFYEYDDGDEFYVVGSGRIKIYKMSMGGQIKALAYLQKGDFFGEMALLENRPRSASAIVSQDSELFVIKQTDFKKFLISNPEMLFTILETLSQRLRQADLEIEMFTFKKVKHRLMSCLIYLADQYGEKTDTETRISKEFTHQDLSELVGTAREVITRLLKELKSEGLIEIKDRCILLPSIKNLNLKILE